MRHAVVALLWMLQTLPAVETGYVERLLTHNGMARRYTTYVPAAVAADPGRVRSLVLVLHGGFGGPDSMRNMLNQTPNRTPLDGLAERDGWILVYPSGSDGTIGTAATGNHWNDDRPALSTSGATTVEGVDDVGFLLAVADACAGEWNADASRLHLAGHSNGAYMATTMVRAVPQRIAAIAAVCGALIATNSNTLTIDSFAQGTPAVFLSGTADPIVPYAGGGETFGSIYYTLLASETGVGRWATLVRAGSMVSTTLPDTAPADGSSVRLDRREQWPDGDGCAVHAYAITGGGHTWPDAVQNLPVGIVGPTCRDISGNEVIWDFFATRARVNAPNVVVAPAGARPVWSWSASGTTGGFAVFRYAMSADQLAAAVETAATAFEPTTDLLAGTHRLMVQERNAFGTWSAPASAEIVIGGGTSGSGSSVGGSSDGGGCGAGVPLGLLLLACAFQAVLRQRRSG